MNGDPKESIRYFGRVAAEWDNLRQSFFSESLREKAVGVAGVQPGKLAVDVGAGSGFVTETLVDKGLGVIALDQSEAMIEQMKRKYGNNTMVSLLKGEAQNLPIADDTADYVFANMLLHYVEDPPVAIRARSLTSNQRNRRRP